MLLATSDSAVAKKPRLRLSMRRSSSLSPSSDFHRAMSACIATSLGIQWWLQPARYFSHAQAYLSGRSWLTSARALIIALSSTSTRAPSRSISPSPLAALALFTGVLLSTLPSRYGVSPEGAVDGKVWAGHRARPTRVLLAGLALGVVEGAGLTLGDLELVLVGGRLGGRRWIGGRRRARRGRRRGCGD